MLSNSPISSIFCWSWAYSCSNPSTIFLAVLMTETLLALPITKVTWWT